MASQLMPFVLNQPFEIQLRGVRNPKLMSSYSSLFGKEKCDNILDYMVPTLKDVIDEQDVLIAVTKIDTSILSKGMNGLVKGEFPLYPTNVAMESLDRESICTNDINAIRLLTKPPIWIPSDAILQAQMTLEVSIDLVGCKPKDIITTYSRLYCLARDKEAIAYLLLKIMKTNEATLTSKDRSDLLTGFVLDTGSTVLFYVEGCRGAILKIWEFTEDFYPILKPIFSGSDKHIDRIYTGMLSSDTPYNILKMFAPLKTFLSCPHVYIEPALPLPARTALLRIGRLIASNFKIIPTLNDMPTYKELNSFRLELCVPAHPESTECTDRITI